MKKIKYIGFYNTYENEVEKRTSVVSAKNKMDYIISKLNELNFKVDIISPAWTTNNKFYKGKKIRLNNINELSLPPTIHWNKISKFFSIILSQLWLLSILLFRVKRNEKILVYHSLYLMYPLYLVNKIKSFDMILEVEELYQHIKKTPKFLRRMENTIVSQANGYIFPTELLNNKINTNNKPFSIVYGSYKMEQETLITSIQDNHKIHVVYAGTFDPNKGVNLAVSVAEFLPKEYHLHIIGYGTEKQKENVLNHIEFYNNISKCKVSYDGFLKGQDYKKFIQNCHIGLSPQSSTAKFNETSFPSKILSYLGHGLRVVSIKIKAIEKSELSNKLYFYENDEPREIAEVIKSIDLREFYDSKAIIKTLDNKFINDLKKLLEYQK